MHELVTRTKLLQDELFPKYSLQERYCNFSDFYEIFGKDLILILFNNINPLKMDFTVVEL